MSEGSGTEVSDTEAIEAGHDLVRDRFPQLLDAPKSVPTGVLTLGRECGFWSTMSVSKHHATEYESAGFG